MSTLTLELTQGQGRHPGLIASLNAILQRILFASHCPGPERERELQTEKVKTETEKKERNTERQRRRAIRKRKQRHEQRLVVQTG